MTKVIAKKFIATTDDGQDMSEELLNFAKQIGLETAVPGRYSFLLLLGLFGSSQSGLLNPAKVMREIEALEGIGIPSRLKQASPLKHPPLKGLWHKHYLEDGLSAMAFNLDKGMEKIYGIPFVEQRIREAQEAGEERYVSIDDCQSIANDVVQGNWMRLANDSKLTGEWIVYAQHEGMNYYLCLGKHDRNRHSNLRKQIDAVCCQEFPFLNDLLSGT